MTKRRFHPLHAPHLALAIAAFALAATPASSRDSALDAAAATTSGTGPDTGADQPSFTAAFAPFSEPVLPGARTDAVDITSIAPAQESAADIGQGIASFYAQRFHGRPTASGERYDMQPLTAAAKSAAMARRALPSLRAWPK